jgi:hypothetical protein
MRVVEAGSTFLPALFCIRKLGFTVRTGDGICVATKDDLTCEARSWESLLGVITMVSLRGADWAKWTPEDYVYNTERRS